MSEENEKIIAYKGFDKNFSCRGFQYEIGKTYTHKGKAVKCTNQGFHACKYPLDVLIHYSPASSKFAIVESFGNVDGDAGDTKIASASITIKAELKLPELVQHAIDWISSKIDKSIKQTVIGSVATNTGDRSVATNTGDLSVATNTGDLSIATNTGYRSIATNTGYRSIATNTGDLSVATNTGYRSVATNTGDLSIATNTGYRSIATNTGDLSVATNTGYRSVAIATGWESKAKASESGAIVLVFRGKEGEIVHIRASKVGENGIKPDTYYMLNASGEFAEADV